MHNAKKVSAVADAFLCCIFWWDYFFCCGIKQMPFEVSLKGLVMSLVYEKAALTSACARKKPREIPGDYL